MDSAVVTGAGRGIGRAVAAGLVERGYAVVVTDVDGDAARRTASEIGAVAGLEQDVRDEATHAAVAAEAARHGRLAVWVNNAGVGYDGTLTDVTSERVDALVDVNLKGVLWGMRAALAAFGPGGGDVVNVASISGLGPVPGLAVYAATKAAVVSITMSAAVEAPDGRAGARDLSRRRRRRHGGRDGPGRSRQGDRALVGSPADRRRGGRGRDRADRLAPGRALPAPVARGTDPGRPAAAVAVRRRVPGCSRRSAAG